MSEAEEPTENPTTEEGVEDEPVKEEESTATFEPVVSQSQRCAQYSSKFDGRLLL